MKEYQKYALAIPRRRAERSQVFISKKIYCYDKTENIRNYSVSLNVRKDFEYLAEVNEIIMNALEAGLIQKWENDGQPIKSHDEKMYNFIENSNSQLSNAMLLSMALSLVVMVLSAEIIINRQVEALYRHNFSIFVHKIFSRYREVFTH